MVLLHRLVFGTLQCSCRFNCRSEQSSVAKSHGAVSADQGRVVARPTDSMAAYPFPAVGLPRPVLLPPSQSRDISPAVSPAASVAASQPHFPTRIPRCGPRCLRHLLNPTMVMRRFACPLHIFHLISSPAPTPSHLYHLLSHLCHLVVIPAPHRRTLLLYLTNP